MRRGPVPQRLLQQAGVGKAIAERTLQPQERRPPHAPTSAAGGQSVSSPRRTLANRW